MQYEKDIKIRTQKFAIEIVKLFVELKKASVIDYVLIRQLLRSGTSVGANTREAKASSSRKELIRYYEIALKSANETDFWFQVIKGGYDMDERFNKYEKELEEISKVIGAIVVKLKKGS
jgi:four helix bundle protein